MSEKLVSACCHAHEYVSSTDTEQLPVCWQCRKPFEAAPPKSQPTNPESAKKYRRHKRRNRAGNFGCLLVPIVIVAMFQSSALRHWLMISLFTVFVIFLIKSLWDDRIPTDGKIRQLASVLVPMIVFGLIIYFVQIAIDGFRSTGTPTKSCHDRVTEQWFNGQLSDTEFRAKLNSECGEPNPVLP